jgi:hypothetical protein
VRIDEDSHAKDRVRDNQVQEFAVCLLYSLLARLPKIKIKGFLHSIDAGALPSVAVKTS